MSFRAPRNARRAKHTYAVRLMASAAISLAPLAANATTLEDVVARYDRVRKLGLTATRKQDVVEYLKSL